MDKHYDPETRRHPAGGGLDTVPPEASETAAASRNWMLPLAGVGVGALLVGTMVFVYRLGVEHATPNALIASASPSSAPSAAATRVLLLDPVCRKAVDPATAPAVLDFGGKSIYFDSLDCLNAFRSDPVKYGAGRIRVHIAPIPEESASPAADPTAPPVGGASPEDPSAGTSAPPDGPSNGGEPSNGETLDDAPATDAPPNGETLDEPDAGTTPEAPAVAEPPAKAPKSTRKAPARPPQAAPSDGGEFSLPPELKEGPPPRRPGGRPAPAATEGLPQEENPPPQ